MGKFMVNNKRSGVICKKANFKPANIVNKIAQVETKYKIKIEVDSDTKKILLKIDYNFEEKVSHIYLLYL